VHRHPGIWTDPEGFDPQRFLDAQKPPPRGSYFPFGAGPRQCIGNQFALMEAELVLASLLPRLRFELRAGAPVEADPSITLRPRHGLPMFVAAA
jgi:cytochrome P450